MLHLGLVVVSLVASVMILGIGAHWTGLHRVIKLVVAIALLVLATCGLHFYLAGLV